MTAAIEVLGVSRQYTPVGKPAVTAVDNVEFQVEPGEFVTIVGPSGCGKTTLLMMCAGLDSPTDGSIRISGQNMDSPRMDTGIVFQRPVLLPWKSVLENVLLPIRSRRKPNRSDREKARALLEEVNLADFEQSLPRELSGGMAQRTGLARGLITDPKVLFFDEPFAALDSMTRERLMVLLAEIWKDQDKAALFITHNIIEAVFLGDRVFVMSDRPGKIIADIKIDFPKPRNIDILASDEFNHMVEHVREVLENR